MYQTITLPRELHFQHFYPTIQTDASLVVTEYTKRLNNDTISDDISFPFNNFTCFLTLFSKCFSSFDHSTCALSVSGRYLALGEIYLPFRAAFPNNSTRRRSYVEGANQSRTGFSPSVTSCSKELRPAAAQKHPLQITTRACARFQI